MAKSSKVLIYRRIGFSLLLISYLCFMAYGALSSDIGRAIPNGMDKVLHFLEFLILAALILLTLSAFPIPRLYTYIIAFALSLILGILSEFMQKWFTKTRSFSWFDFLADAIGITLALILMVVFEWISSRQSS